MTTTTTTATDNMFATHAIGTLASPCNRGKKREGKIKVKRANIAKVERLTPTQDELQPMVYNKTNVPFTDCEGLTDYIAKNNVHVGIARNVIKSLAFRPSADGTQKACMDIVKSGYTQAIVQDIEQDMYITLFEMIADGRLTYNETTNQLEFNTQDGNPCFKSVRRSLGMYKDSPTKHEIIASDLIYTDAEGVDHSITMNNPLYTYQSAIQYDGGIEGLINDGRIVDIMKFIKNHTSPTKYNTIVKVIEGLVHKMNYDEIASHYNISTRTVKRARKELKDLYSQWGHFELTTNPVYRFGGSLKSYGRAANRHGVTGAAYTIGSMHYEKPVKPSVIYTKTTAAYTYKHRKAFNKLVGRIVSDWHKDGTQALLYHYDDIEGARFYSLNNQHRRGNNGIDWLLKSARGTEILLNAMKA